MRLSTIIHCIVLAALTSTVLADEPRGLIHYRPLESVEMTDNRITTITMETGETIKAAVFIDATYEGDLFAAANVSHHVGREPAATYGESLGGQWPHSIYVREGRRMLSDYVMTQANCESKRVAEDSVGLASYNMDSHPCQRVVVERDGVTTVISVFATADF